MDLNAIMATQLSDLQQTVQLNVLQNAMNIQTTQLLEQLPEQPQAVHPFKGTTIDIQV